MGQPRRLKAPGAHGRSSNEEKEGVVRELSSTLERAGYVVRREKLKQGHGWKVVSGTCQTAEQRLVFVDRKASLDDQILFLKGLVSRLDD